MSGFLVAVVQYVMCIVYTHTINYVFVENTNRGVTDERIVLMIKWKIIKHAFYVAASHIRHFLHVCVVSIVLEKFYNYLL